MVNGIYQSPRLDLVNINVFANFIKIFHAVQEIGSVSLFCFFRICTSAVPRPMTNGIWQYLWLGLVSMYTKFYQSIPYALRVFILAYLICWAHLRSFIKLPCTVRELWAIVANRKSCYLSIPCLTVTYVFILFYLFIFIWVLRPVKIISLILSRFSHRPKVGAKTGDPREKKNTWPPARRTWLVSHVTQARRWDDAKD